MDQKDLMELKKTKQTTQYIKGLRGPGKINDKNITSNLIWSKTAKYTATEIKAEIPPVSTCKHRNRILVKRRFQGYRQNAPRQWNNVQSIVKVRSSVKIHVVAQFVVNL